MPTDERQPGYDLSVSVTPQAFEVLRAIRVERVSRFRLHAPVLTPERSARLKTPASELVLTLLDGAGDPVERFGWPGTATLFDDRINLRTGDFTGSPFVATNWFGQLRFPVGSASVRYLFFSRTDVGIGPDRTPAFSEKAIGAYDLKAESGPPFPPWPLPWPDPPIPLPLPPVGPDFKHLRPRERRIPPEVLATRLPDVRRIIDSGRPSDNAFDIVILSEGFQNAELPTFWMWATLLANGLVLTAPYAAFQDRINVHGVGVASEQSGVTLVSPPGLPPENVVVNTFVQCKGYFHGKPSRTFFGTDALGVVQDAVSWAVPYAQADLIAILVNLAVPGGGSADPPNRQIFVPLIADPDKFINTVAHESGHVVAHAGEEYIGCIAYNVADDHPNVATQDEVDADAVPWKSLARPNELRSDGRFAAVHAYGDPMTAECQPIMSGALTGALGLYWGCQYTDPAIGSACDPYCDQRSASFYRPMAECKMRRSRYTFCRVCAKKISEAILSAAP